MNSLNIFSITDKVWFFNIILFIFGLFFPPIIILAILLNILLIIFNKKKKNTNFIKEEKDFSSAYETFIRFKKEAEELKF